MTASRANEEASTRRAIGERVGTSTTDGASKVAAPLYGVQLVSRRKIPTPPAPPSE
jgi:hypothetical protein